MAIAAITPDLDLVDRGVQALFVTNSDRDNGVDKCA